MNKADYIFETSWEICNKVGGIHTVLSTKSFTVVNKFKDNYICIGPDLSIENGKADEFIEDFSLYKNWKAVAWQEGLRIRIGRWNISGNPVVILVDFTPFFEKKNEILTQFWLKYKLDSISGQWDYVEPALFGYAAGRVIESFYQFYCNAQDNIVAHFHEWMTGTGILHLNTTAPQIATVFTTHATVLGRSIAGNGLPLYENIEQYDPLLTASKFNVQSKFSLEYLSANIADGYTTVSEITNKECVAFFKKPADVVTINGFENNFVPQDELYDEKRAVARKRLKQVASALLQQPISENPLFVINSGRYEFKNKGIDVFIRALAELQKREIDREIIAFLAIPAGTSGMREELIEKINNKVVYTDSNNAVLRDYATHPLHAPNDDPIIKELNRLNIDNSPESKVKVIFIPVYLNGHDGIFNLTYYDLLIGFDLSVFPSYYEPWGYTPLESVAFGIPTITTSLAGFGMWVKNNFGNQKSAWVIHRSDYNDEQVCFELARAISYFAECTPDEVKENKIKAFEIAKEALWEKLYANYLKVYDIAITKANLRFELFKDKTSKIDLIATKIKKPEPKWKRVTVKSYLTENLKKLEELAYNLWWSWNYQARELFMEIAGPKRWTELEENPIHVLQVLPLDVIQRFNNDAAFIKKLDAVYDEFQEYMSKKQPNDHDQVAYFSMEFGITNELKIFSGGLGMLAGDYLKEASDSNVNMIAVGLLYRSGYFAQQISQLGDQINHYPNQSFSKLPMTPIRDENGNFAKVSVALPGRNLYARIWQVDIGRVSLYLLDTDFNENSPEDRKTTYNLSGGDIENRLKQEFLLGIGGIRMLRLLNIKPTIYHLNEGHAAFLSLERLRNIMEDYHLPLSVAMEVVKSSSLYTTHTAVPAGHDAFSEDLMRIYFASYPEKYHISWEEFMAFGRKDVENVHDKFSMSILACKLSQEINGVSKIHGRVTREMFSYLYDGHFSEELHIGYVTNGVHYPTWAHKKWQILHKKVFGNQFITSQSDSKNWKKIPTVDKQKIWDIRNELRKELIDNVKILLEQQMRRRNESPTLIVQTLKSLRSDVLTVGFARRFATYKRAHLLFMNEERLRTLVNNPTQPMQFIFAGKAHPHDKAGQDLIKKIIEFSRKPCFIGKIIFLENYDMIIAKKLVSGCDVWLNTPTRPMEASGTSGEKAVMNGVLNFSVLDGWWAEGYVQGAGWALSEHATYQNHGLQDELDAATLYAVFEEQIAPIFYDRNDEDVPEKWVEMIKQNFARIAPHYTMERQLKDYYRKFYNKLFKRKELLIENDFERAKQLVRWKERVITAWDNIQVVEIVKPPMVEDNTFFLGTTLHTYVKLKLGNLHPEDIKMEYIFTNRNEETVNLQGKFAFEYVETSNGIATFHNQIHAKFSGVWNCAIRIIPAHPLLPHDMDFNLVTWL